MARHEPIGTLPPLGNPGRRRRRMAGRLSARPEPIVVVTDAGGRPQRVRLEPLDTGIVVIGGATLPKKGRRGRITIEGWLTPEDD